jgi:hypothetical protein
MFERQFQVLDLHAGGNERGLLRCDLRLASFEKLTRIDKTAKQVGLWYHRLAVMTDIETRPGLFSGRSLFAHRRQAVSVCGRHLCFVSESVT